ncbi:adenosine deaminase [Microbacterium sp. JB110]|uniref:adenosine deaminase n=1 Tax=Microbacterium sp. JB110 TaxID=2024477 RepID=UPI00097ED7ED|nr:adenosine deaminase [Microbacterium sp. JB110]RCS61413.1 adenosine deaminase [Microbacterium sp. JB110]SJM65339.1 Adenosine deaminase [Frigoribacterium sp. JB110]
MPRPNNSKAQRHEATIEGVPVRSLPKIALHEHLDGGLRAETVLELAREAGVEVPVSDERGLGEWFAEQAAGGSLEAYLETFALTGAVLQTADALTRAARELVEDLTKDGVIYAEVRWAPELHTSGGLSMAEAVDAVQEGIEQGEDDAEATGHSIRVGQILSAMRQAENSLEVAELALDYRDDGVVGFDLAGPESGHPASEHRDALDLLATEFFPVTLHAGEEEGTDSIRSALLDGRALRLGHGVRIAEDLDVIAEEGEDVRVRLGDLAAWVRDREIALEVAPSSNLGTGAIARWGSQLEDHPFDLLYQLGFAVTVNTDNRLMSRTTLTRELSMLADTFEYRLADLERFQLNAAAAAFLPVEQREELIDLISEGFDR